MVHPIPSARPRFAVVFTSPRAERICSRSLNPTSRGDSDGLGSSVAYFGSVRSCSALHTCRPSLRKRSHQLQCLAIVVSPGKVVKRRAVGASALSCIVSILASFLLQIARLANHEYRGLDSTHVPRLRHMFDHDLANPKELVTIGVLDAARMNRLLAV